jgi:uncharacterized protein (DUF2147 family)
MTNCAFRAALSLLFAVIASGSPAMDPDQSPAGEWLVKDGTAHIRIALCNGKLWGVISWVNAPDTDKNNPDVSKRGRSTLGLPILLGMQPAKTDEWDGDIYNAENGKIYNGDISLKSANTLHVEGCVFGGLICGGEDWTRLDAQQRQESSDEVCRQAVSGDAVPVNSSHKMTGNL